MYRPTGFADLAGRRVGVFGYGVEGRASVRRLAQLDTDTVIVDDEPHDAGVLATDEGGYDALRTCELVLKSPGIPRRRSDILALEEAGVTVTSALNLWLHEVDRRRVIGITGTKGKSTTTALVAFFLRCLDEVAHEVGNLGQPPYDPDVNVSTGWLVLEVSSFQCVDITLAPRIVIVTSLGADHLDWHGSLEQYHEDKLSLTRARGEHDTIIGDEAQLESAMRRMGGRVSVAPPDASGLARRLGLLGAHNDRNVGIALAACSLATGQSLSNVHEAVVRRAGDFVALPGRLTLVASHVTVAGTVRYVDDGLATGPLPTIAALRVFTHDVLALIAGGFDRGVDYEDLARELSERHAITTVVVMGPAGERLARLCEALQVHFAVDMDDAVRRAQRAVGAQGVVLFSPAAPSFDAYRNWIERSQHFARAVSAVTPQD